MVDSALPSNNDLSQSLRSSETLAHKNAQKPIISEVKEGFSASKDKDNSQKTPVTLKDGVKEPGVKVPTQDLSPEEIEAKVQELNEQLGHNTRLNFHVNRETGKLVVEVIDKVTDEVIKTIPPDDLEEVARRLPHGSLLVDSTT